MINYGNEHAYAWQRSDLPMHGRLMAGKWTAEERTCTIFSLFIVRDVIEPCRHGLKINACSLTGAMRIGPCFTRPCKSWSLDYTSLFYTSLFYTSLLF
jgi:hypothetical protein